MKTTVRGAIEVLLLAVFLGIIMMWIMVPTDTYKLKWQVKIKATANTTYFGTQGTNILVFVFPMLFLAALGCVFLHLGKKCGDNHSPDEKKSPSQWRRPVLVKGPLGVVSWIELAFFVMFISLLVWYFGTYLRTGFATITPKSLQKSGEKLWEAKLDKAAVRLGLVGNLCFALLFIPVTRGSSLLSLIGLTSESSIKYHIWLGHIVMTLFTAHGLCYILYWAVTSELSEMLTWENTGVSNLAGEFSLLAGLAMWATTFPKIRRKMFELFFYTHYLYIVFVVFFVYHVPLSHVSMMLPGFYLFLIDRYLRFLQSRQNVRLLSSRLLPCETVELNFSKSTELAYSPTSVIFINVPSISRLQWHPFTITSSSNLEADKLSVVIKKEGSWSQKLYQILSAPSSVERLAIAVEGPYGPSSTHYLRYDTLVMVSGGSGITPFFSIIRDLISMSTTMNIKTPKIFLVCVFKNSADLTMLDLLLPLSESFSDMSRLQLEIEAYVTQEKQNTMSVENKNLIRTVWFKPSPSDQPISAVLGSNSWLWLGAIISCSFVIYLILLGIINRYYIYPIDHDSNNYSSVARGSIHMLLICICISMVASVVVLKNKKRNAMEAKKVQITNVQTPTTSPGSWFHNAERELESLPNQSIVQATNVHYGSRPDLKKTLFECEGSSIGVMVSGPTGMRHDVATICSSGLADNLHYESISFSW
ncbi:ferric-chelate reductase (NADH) [Ranunculus cassubicifolius]